MTAHPPPQPVVSQVQPVPDCHQPLHSQADGQAAAASSRGSSTRGRAAAHIQDSRVEQGQQGTHKAVARWCGWCSSTWCWRCPTVNFQHCHARRRGGRSGSHTAPPPLYCPITTPPPASSAPACWLASSILHKAATFALPRIAFPSTALLPLPPRPHSLCPSSSLTTHSPQFTNPSIQSLPPPAVP